MRTINEVTYSTDKAISVKRDGDEWIIKITDDDVDSVIITTNEEDIINLYDTLGFAVSDINQRRK